jgi:hypothetical protein
MADDAHRDSPPPFDRPFEGADTKQRVYGAILHAREPMTAAEVAERADCSPESARTHLSFYADLGIVIHHEGRPARYERNDDYFEWRRTNWRTTTLSTRRTPSASTPPSTTTRLQQNAC